MKKLFFLLIITPVLLNLISNAASSPKIFIGITTDKSTFKSGEPITMALTILNQNSKPYQAQFASAQIYDFCLYKEDGQLIWKWSGDKMFSMALQTLKLEPNKPLTYVSCNQILPSEKPLEPGNYKLVGLFCIREKPLSTNPVTIEIRK